MEPRTGAGRGDGRYFTEACRGRRCLQGNLTEWRPDYLSQELSRERETQGFRPFSEGGTEMRQAMWFQAVNNSERPLGKRSPEYFSPYLSIMPMTCLWIQSYGFHSTLQLTKCKNIAKLLLIPQKMRVPRAVFL